MPTSGNEMRDLPLEGGNGSEEEATWKRCFAAPNTGGQVHRLHRGEKVAVQEAADDVEGVVQDDSTVAGSGGLHGCDTCPDAGSKSVDSAGNVRGTRTVAADGVDVVSVGEHPLLLHCDGQRWGDGDAERCEVEVEARGEDALVTIPAAADEDAPIGQLGSGAVLKAPVESQDGASLQCHVGESRADVNHVQTFGCCPAADDGDCVWKCAIQLPNASKMGVMGRSEPKDNGRW